MPTYVFLCDDEAGGCGKLFDTVCLMAEIATKKPTCPFCSNKVAPRRHWQSQTIYSYMSVRTVGALAEHNTNKKSSDEIHHIHKKNTSYIQERKKAPLPAGMSRATVDTKRSPDIDPRKNKRKKPNG